MLQWRRQIYRYNQPVSQHVKRVQPLRCGHVELVLLGERRGALLHLAAASAQSVNCRCEKKRLAASGSICGWCKGGWEVWVGHARRHAQGWRRLPCVAPNTTHTRTPAAAHLYPTCMQQPSLDGLQQPTWLPSTSVRSMGCTARFSSLRQKGFFTGSSFSLASSGTRRKG